MRPGAGDPTRTRRHSERHLRLVAPQRRCSAALAAAAPGRVLWLDTAARAALVSAVCDAVEWLPAEPIGADRLLPASVALVMLSRLTVLRKGRRAR